MRLEMGFGFGLMEFLFPLIFLAFFIMFFVILFMNISKGISTWKCNNNSPRLTVEAKVVAKRDEFYRGHHSSHHHTASRTTYYVTFEFESGDRLELEVDGSEYGMVVEGDNGKLTFQGTRFLGFERIF